MLQMFHHDKVVLCSVWILNLVCKKCKVYYCEITQLQVRVHQHTILCIMRIFNERVILFNRLLYDYHTSGCHDSENLFIF